MPPQHSDDIKQQAPADNGIGVYGNEVVVDIKATEKVGYVTDDTESDSETANCITTTPADATRAAIAITSITSNNSAVQITEASETSAASSRRKTSLRKREKSDLQCDGKCGFFGDAAAVEAHNLQDCSNNFESKTNLQTGRKRRRTRQYGPTVTEIAVIKNANMVCDQGCGFEGTLEIVEAHEQTCTVECGGKTKAKKVSSATKQPNAKQASAAAERAKRGPDDVWKGVPYPACIYDPIAIVNKQDRCSVSEPQCHAAALSRGLCKRHGGSHLCRVPGCFHKTADRNLCNKHGGEPMAESEGETPGASKSTVERKKSATKICAHYQCTNTWRNYYLCASHGGYGICSHPECEANASQGGRGLCQTHMQHGWCAWEDQDGRCAAKEAYRGLCALHVSKEMMANHANPPSLCKELAAEVPAALKANHLELMDEVDALKHARTLTLSLKKGPEKKEEAATVHNDDSQPMFTCHACTVRNPIVKSKCTMCGTARKRQAPRRTTIRGAVKDEAKDEGNIHAKVQAEVQVELLEISIDNEKKNKHNDVAEGRHIALEHKDEQHDGGSVDTNDKAVADKTLQGKVQVDKSVEVCVEDAITVTKKVCCDEDCNGTIYNRQAALCTKHWKLWRDRKYKLPSQTVNGIAVPGLLYMNRSAAKQTQSRKGAKDSKKSTSTLHRSNDRTRLNSRNSSKSTLGVDIAVGVPGSAGASHAGDSNDVAANEVVAEEEEEKVAAKERGRGADTGSKRNAREMDTQQFCDTEREDNECVLAQTVVLPEQVERQTVLAQTTKTEVVAISEAQNKRVKFAPDSIGNGQQQQQQQRQQKAELEQERQAKVAENTAAAHAAEADAAASKAGEEEAAATATAKAAARAQAAAAIAAEAVAAAETAAAAKSAEAVAAAETAAAAAEAVAAAEAEATAAAAEAAAAAAAAAAAEAATHIAAAAAAAEVVAAAVAQAVKAEAQAAAAAKAAEEEAATLQIYLRNQQQEKSLQQKHQIEKLQIKQQELKLQQEQQNELQQQEQKQNMFEEQAREREREQKQKRCWQEEKEEEKAKNADGHEEQGTKGERKRRHSSAKEDANDPPPTKLIKIIPKPSEEDTDTVAATGTETAIATSAETAITTSARTAASDASTAVTTTSMSTSPVTTIPITAAAAAGATVPQEAAKALSEANKAAEREAEAKYVECSAADSNSQNQSRSGSSEPASAAHSDATLEIETVNADADVEMEEVYECEYGCNFEDEVKEIVEAHEVTCKFREDLSTKLPRPGRVSGRPGIVLSDGGRAPTPAKGATAQQHRTASSLDEKLGVGAGATVTVAVKEDDNGMTVGERSTRPSKASTRAVVAYFFSAARLDCEHFGFNVRKDAGKNEEAGGTDESSLAVMLRSEDTAALSPLSSTSLPSSTSSSPTPPAKIDLRVTGYVRKSKMGVGMTKMFTRPSSLGRSKVQ